MASEANEDWSQVEPEDETDQDNSSAETTSAEDVEVVEAEVVEQGDIKPASDVEALSTFSEQEGPFSFKVLPVIRDTVTDWRVVVYMQGVQGPVYESTEKISDGAADQLGMSRRLQERINDALEYADKNLEIPSELGDHSRQKRSLHELEVMMEGE